MTPRERILAALRREPLDQISWNGDLDYWMTWLRTENLLAEKYRGEAGRFALHRDLSVGFYLQGHFPFTERYEGVTVDSVTRGNDTRTVYKTPLGELSETWSWTPETYSFAPTEFLLKSADDFPILKYLYAHTTYAPDYGLSERMRARYVGEHGVTLVYTPHTPFMELVARKAGIENLVYAIADDEEGFDELFAVMCEKFDEAAQLAIDSPAECVMIPENLSAESVGKRFYAKYMAPLHKKWTQKIREAGKYSFIHMDGTLRGLIAEVSQCGFDVIEAATPAPTGDMTLEEMRAVTDPDVILWGGIPGGYFTDVVSDEAFDEYVISVLNVMKRHRNFVLGVSDQVVPGADAARIARVQTLVDRYGKYGV